MPIVRKERAIGVLAVQHAEPRAYDEIEIEALQTVAMVLSELIANAGLADKAAAAAADSRDCRHRPPHRAEARARPRQGSCRLPSAAVLIEHTVAEDTEAERHRVYSAFRKMREQIEAMTSAPEFGTAGEHHEILETHKMFAYDEGWSRRINEAIDSGLTAEGGDRARPAAHPDADARDRRSDPRRADARSRRPRQPAAADRLRQLGTAAQAALPSDAILIARNLGPAELLEYDRRKLKGVILEEGSLTTHVTIVARAMGVPMLGRIRDVGA